MDDIDNTGKPGPGNEPEKKPNILKMGEGRDPEEELKGWTRQERWQKAETSDAPAFGDPKKYKKKPDCSISGEALTQVGVTARKGIPIFLSKADGRKKEGEGGALANWERNKDEGEEEVSV